MVCPNCGNSIDDNTKFCNYCGTKLREDPITLTNTSAVKEVKNENVFLGILGSLLG